MEAVAVHISEETEGRSSPSAAAAMTTERITTDKGIPPPPLLEADILSRAAALLEEECLLPLKLESEIFSKLFAFINANFLER